MRSFFKIKKKCLTPPSPPPPRDAKRAASFVQRHLASVWRRRFGGCGVAAAVWRLRCGGCGVEAAVWRGMKKTWYGVS